MDTIVSSMGSEASDALDSRLMTSRGLNEGLEFLLDETRGRWHFLGVGFQRWKWYTLGLSESCAGGHLLVVRWAALVRAWLTVDLSKTCSGVHRLVPGWAVLIRAWGTFGS